LQLESVLDARLNHETSSKVAFSKEEEEEREIRFLDLKSVEVDLP